MKNQVIKIQQVLKNHWKRKQERPLMVLTGLLLVLVWPLCHHLFDEEIKLTVLHTDVLFGRYEPDLAMSGPFEGHFMGGSAMLATQVNQIRQEQEQTGAHTLLLDTGNTVFGGVPTSIGHFKRGLTVLQIMNQMKYDALTVNSTEFDFGVNRLREATRTARFPFLGANLSLAEKVEGRPPFLAPYVIKDYGDIRVGIIGIVNPQIQKFTLPGLMTGVHVHSPEKHLGSAIEELKGKGVQFIVVLSTLLNLQSEIKLAEKFKDDIHVIVSSSKYEDSYQGPIFSGKIPIIKISRKIKSLGRMDFILSKSNKKILSSSWSLYPIVSSKLTADKGVLDLIEKNSHFLEERVDERVIGFSTNDMAYETTTESPFGDFVCDVIQEKFDADVVFINSGTLRGLSAGPITLRKLTHAIPYTNNIVTFPMKGRDIKAVLEKSFEQLHETGILQVGGVRVQYNLSSPPGEKIKSLTIRGEAFDPEKEYSVATILYLWKGGDGFSIFKEKAASVKYHRTLRDMVAEYINEKRKVTAQVDERMMPTLEDATSPALMTTLKGP